MESSAKAESGADKANEQPNRVLIKSLLAPLTPVN